KAELVDALSGETPTAVGMTPAQFEVAAQRARKGRAATAATRYRFTGNSRANTDLFPDGAERVAVSDAFAGYRGIGSRQINRRLRDGDASDARVALMDKAFAKSPLKEDVLVWRGSRGEEFGT